MNRLLEFIQQVNKDMGINMPSDWQKLSNLELAQKFVKGLNRYVFQTYKGIGKVHFQGEEFEYISEFHKFWESNHRLILNASINIEQAHKAAASISHAIQDYGPSILRVMHDTCGLRPQAVAQVRFFTANQDFREPPEKPFSKYLQNPTSFDSKEIAEDPAGFLRFLGMTRLSQTDKRLDFARNAALFLERNKITAFDIAKKYENDARRIRDGLVGIPNIGYGSKKSNMFIRDMIELKVWTDLIHTDEIDVASDINTMKLALRTRIIETEIPLVSSFLDIFCYQYEYIDEMSAKAWRAVWKEWQSLSDEKRPLSPCLIDYFLYRVGHEYCKNNLIRYQCKSGHSFYYFGARLQKCRLCRSPVAAMEKLLPCQVDAKQLPREEGVLMLDEKNLLRTFDGVCIFENVCLPKSDTFRFFDPPKSISIKGQTGWTSAYADRERGGGGLMS